jgi:flavin reductase (DIM6/NTAB) family NADH-FMN oxidoreductase RutF
MAETMTSITTEALLPRDAYRLMISVVVPRPIGWVSTVGADGTPNLAPFSFFNGIASSPPTVMVSVSRRADQPKDTLRNAQETGEFVLNIVDEALATRMNQTAGEWPYEIDEWQQAGLVAVPSVDVRPPRVADAPVALEATVTQIVPVEGTHYTMILGRIVRFHIRDGLLRDNGLVDAELLRPVARLGGDEYATIGGVFAMARPQV